MAAQHRLPPNTVLLLAKTSDLSPVCSKSPLVRHGAFLFVTWPLSVNPRIRSIVGGSLLLAVLGLIYWPGMRGAFFFDDGPSILTASGVQLERLTWDGLRNAWLSGGAGPTGRPLAQLSFALNYFLSGFSPVAFKATNLVIHMLCGGLVYGLMRHVLASTCAAVPESQRRALAGVVAAAWLLHPIQVLPVLHVVQRMTSLAAFFLLAAFWLHVQARENVGRVGLAKLVVAWAVLWPLSILSKETGLLLPIYVLAWEMILHRANVGRLDKFAKGLLLLAGVSAIVVLVYLQSDRGQWVWAGYQMRPFTAAERLMTECRVMWFYISLVFVPRLSAFGLYHDDITISLDWLTPWSTVPSALGLLALAMLVWQMRNRVPLAALGVAWFLVGHTLESTLLPLEIAHEHRNYLPLLGLLWVPLGLVLAGQRVRSSVHPHVLRLATALLGLLAVITALRVYPFGDEIRRTQFAVEYHPQSAQAHYEAGQALAGLITADRSSVSPWLAQIQAHYAQANALNPNFKLALLGQIDVACKTRGAVPNEVAQTLERRLVSTPFAPGDRTVLYSVKEMAAQGELCLSDADVERLFAAAFANPGVDSGVQAILWSWLADYRWLAARDLAGARAALQRSLALNPGNTSNRLKWAQLQFIAGNLPAARKLLTELRGALLSKEERQTLEQVLDAINMATH